MKSLRILAAFLASDFRLDGMGLLTANTRTQRNGQFVAYWKIKAILTTYYLLLLTTVLFIVRASSQLTNGVHHSICMSAYKI